MNDRIRSFSVAALLIAFAATPALCGTLPLSWNPVADPNVAGYRVYYGNASGSYGQSADAGLASSFTLTGLNDCSRYFVAVKSYNTLGVESNGYSNEISGLPSPTLTSVSPASLTRGQSATLTLAGLNFATGAALVSNDNRLTVASTTFVSCNELQAAVTVGAAAADGTIDLDVVNADGSRGRKLSALQLGSGQVAPLVAATTPPDGTTNVATTSRPTVTFNVGIDPATIQTTTVRLLGPGNVALPQAAGSPSLDATGRTVTITPQSNLAYSTNFKIQIIGQSSGVRSLQGNPMISTFLQTAGFMTAPAPAATPAKASPPFWYDDADTAATIYYLSSNDAPPGAYVAIYGDDFGSENGTVTFGAAPATIVSWSGKIVVATVPQGGTGPLTLTRSDGASSSTRAFTVHPGTVRHIALAAPAGGNGTAASPWSTFDAADEGVAPGDFVVVHGGTYTGASTRDAVFQADTSGAANATITYFAMPGEPVYLDATTTAKQAIRMNGNFLNFVGFGMGGAKYQAVLLGGTDNAVVDCEIKNSVSTAGKGHAVNINGARGRAIGNYVHDNYSHGFYAYASGMEIGYNSIVRSGSGAPDARGHGIQFYVQDPGPGYSNGKIYRNYITESNRGAITIGSYSSGADIYENVIEGNEEQCVFIGYNAQNTTFRNNVCYNNGLDTSTGQFAEIELDASAGASGVNVYNNVVTGPLPVKVSAGFATTARFDSNFYQNATSWSWSGTSYASFAEWKTASAQDAGSRTGDPLFAAAGVNDFRPSSSSPLVDAGDDGHCPRAMSGAHCDLGAYESLFASAPVALEVASTTPADGATTVPVSSRPTVAFNTPMNASTVTPDSVRILGPGASPVPQAAGSPSLDATGRVVTIVPAQNLGFETLYQIQVVGLESGVASAQGSRLPATFQHAVGFRTAPQPPPLGVSSTSPAAGDSGASPTVRPAVSFNVAVSAATVSPSTIQLLGPNGNPIPQAPGSPALNAAGTMATITCSSRLVLNTTYRIHVVGGDGGVRDLIGGTLASNFLMGPGFTTAVGTPPTVAATSPADGAIRVPIEAHPTITFNEAMDPASITAENLRIIGAGNFAVTQAPGSPALDPTGRIATLVPAAPLGYGAVYQIQVIGMDGGVMDVEGAPLDGEYRHAIGFRTKDVPVPPRVVDSRPPDNTIGKPLDVHPTVTFSKPVDPATVTINTVRLKGPDGVPVAQAPGSPFLDATGTIATIVPANPLGENSLYRIQVFDVQDLDGNRMSASFNYDPGFQTLNLPPANVPNFRRRDVR